MIAPGLTTPPPSRLGASALSRRAVVTLHERLLEPLGLTYCQQLVLVALEAGATRRSALRARLLLSARTMEDALVPSLASGLVQEEHDGRGAAWGVLDLTDRGRTHLPRLREIGDRVREQSGTTSEDRALLRRLIASTA
ncbi:hypothetical protein [Clavibacter michiganensis]|uniref:MarR family transcriptional regulator n=1 Tax=Clavibacter michiganensis TaxID=28447 RepID=A0A251YFX3_9MICO|nr:hypothetical protein [Clavibacter michiganensis]OUE23121.1 hypothetical protein BFL37_14270 [Clavibacter michiganensis]